MRLKSVRDRRPVGLPQEDFSVRLRTPEGVFIFGFHVGKRREYWRIAGMSEEFGNESEAMEALGRKQQERRAAS
jgi:hypothetical protein